MCKAGAPLRLQGTSPQWRRHKRRSFALVHASLQMAFGQLFTQLLLIEQPLLDTWGVGGLPVHVRGGGRCGRCLLAALLAAALRAGRLSSRRL